MHQKKPQRHTSFMLESGLCDRTIQISDFGKFYIYIIAPQLHHSRLGGSRTSILIEFDYLWFSLAQFTNQQCSHGEPGEDLVNLNHFTIHVYDDDPLNAG